MNKGQKKSPCMCTGIYVEYLDSRLNKYWRAHLEFMFSFQVNIQTTGETKLQVKSRHVQTTHTVNQLCLNLEALLRFCLKVRKETCYQ